MASFARIWRLYVPDWLGVFTRLPFLGAVGHLDVTVSPAKTCRTNGSESAKEGSETPR